MSSRGTDGRGAAHGRGWGVLLLALALAGLPAHAADKVGEAVYAKGAAMAKDPGGQVRLLGRGIAVYEGDVLTTAPRSVAIIHFDDGTKMTMRPRSTFRVDKFSQVRGRESLFVRFFRGGMRAVTGLVSQRNPNGFRVQTSVATIGIRGTDFTARLCDDDCAREASARPGSEQRPRPVVAGRMAFARGEIKRIDGEARERRLRVGGAVFEGDILETGPGTFGVITFRDQTRITLQANTRFQIEQLKYDRKRPNEGSAFLRLFRGGLRVVTGLIGETRPRSFRLRTPVATIGIRGTGFDVVCSGDCVGDAQARAGGPAGVGQALLEFLVPRAEAQVVNGIYILPWLGTTLVNFRGQTYPLTSNQNALFRAALAAPRFLQSIPQTVLQQLGQRPDGVPVDPNWFADAEPSTNQDLQVYVEDGGLAVVAKDGTGEEKTTYVATGEGVEVSPGGARYVDQGSYITDDENLPNPGELNERGEPRQRVPSDDSMSCNI